MDLRHLETFRQVATCGSFTRAAQRLGYVQSNVTAHIQALEAELGVQLFDRIGRRIRLTDAGERLLGHATRMLVLADEARQIVSAGLEGQLTISAPETLCVYRLPAVLRRARAELPGLRVTFRPAPGSDLRRLVRAGDLDLAFTLEPERASDKLQIELLRPEPIWLIGPPGHHLASRAAIRPADLAGESILLTEAGCSYRERFEQSLADGGIEIRETLEFSSVEAIKQCAMAGMGLAVLPAITVQREVAQGDLARIDWGGRRFDVTTQLVRHAERWRSAGQQAFIAIAREVLSAP